MAKNAVHLVNAALLAGLFAGSALVFDALPERIPIRFGWDGTPNSFVETTWLSWMLLPLVALFVAAVCYGGAWMVRRFPGLANLPGCQAEYDALSPAGKQQALRPTRRFLYWTAAGTLALLAVIHSGTYAVAAGGGEQLPPYASPWLGIGCTLAVIIGTVWLVRVTRVKVVRLHAEEQAAPEMAA